MRFALRLVVDNGASGGGLGPVGMVGDGPLLFY